MVTRSLSPTAAAPVDVCFVVLPQTLLLDLAGPAEAFRLANQALVRQGRAPLWRLRHVGPQPQVDSSVGLQLTGLEPLPEGFERPTWVFLLAVVWERVRRWAMALATTTASASAPQALWPSMVAPTSSPSTMALAVSSSPK